MEIWQRQLLGLLASVGWLLAIAILAFLFSYLLGAGNPLRKEALLGVAIPIVYGSPVLLGLAAFIGWKWDGLTRQEIALFGAPVLISLFGLITTLILG